MTTLYTRAAAILSLSTVVTFGCGTTRYTVHSPAEGEIILKTGNGRIYLDAWEPADTVTSSSAKAGYKRVASSPTFAGIANYVRCVPQARPHAERAEYTGRAWTGLAVAGASLAALSLFTLAGLADSENQDRWLGTGVSLGGLSMTLALVGFRYKRIATGSALDAMNYYNDARGAWGLACGITGFRRPPDPQ